MNKIIKKKRWNEEELKILKNYSKENEIMLLKVFYNNIYEGKQIFRKRDGFFKDLGKLINRKSSECKSKFQKHEQIIYTSYLKVPYQHYQLFSFYRKQNKTKNNIELTSQLKLLHRKIVAKMNSFNYEISDLKCNYSNFLAIKTNSGIFKKKIPSLNKITLPSLKKKTSFFEILSSKCPPPLSQQEKLESPERSIFSILQEKRNFQFFKQSDKKQIKNNSIIKTNKILSTGLNHIDNDHLKNSDSSGSKENFNKCFKFDSLKVLKSMNLDCLDLLQSENSPPQN